MKIKKLIIITILISSTAMLFGCDSTKTNESSNNSNETKITSDAANDNSSTSKTKETINKNNVYKKSNETTNNDNLTYKSKLGLSMKFPSSWKDKYRIEEDDKGLYVYFKSKNPTTAENEGLIFLIEKTYNSTEAGMLDSIGGKKYITVNNITYLIGGPTDIGLSSENAEFDKYTSMRNECEKVIDTVTSSN